MVKKRLLLLLLLTQILMIFTSCGLDYRHSLNGSLHNQIEFVWKENDISYVIYQGNKYIFIGTTNFFSVDTYEVDVNSYKSYEDDILLSWNGYRYYGYIDEYYSYTLDSPIFIYNARLNWVFFREDYNYIKDTFVIDEIAEEIIWEDIFNSPQNSFDFTDPIKVVLSSKQCPRITTYVKLMCVKNQWYLSLADSEDVWTPSDKFIKILSENGII